MSEKNILFTRDHIIGLVFLILGVAGFLYTVFGEFSEGAGLGAHLLPRLSFLIIVAAGISLLLDKGQGFQPRGDLEAVNVPSVLIFIGMGLIYFLLVLRLGLIVSTLLYSWGLFSLLTVEPLKHWKQVVLPGIFITLLIWIMFTRVLSIILPDPLLF
jgi:hypothetical protein